MKILELRILPPIAIGRLGASEIPMDAYDLQVDKDSPLDFREIVPKPSFRLSKYTGKLKQATPESIVFKDGNGIDDKKGLARPVAPFLEVFALTDKKKDTLVPLTTHLLKEAGLSLDDISWHIDVANIKLYRRTQAKSDKITARINNLTTHRERPLRGRCRNFLRGKTLPLGTIQFIRPTEEFPQVRLRYTPGPGRVYGASETRIPSAGAEPVADPVYEQHKDDFIIYDKSKPWFGYVEGNQKWPILTNPGAIFAGYNGADDTRISWGYLDDECDGFASVHLKQKDGSILKARAHISAGPPAYAPDTLPVRVVSDELEQILLGPDVDKEVPIEEAEDIVRRALETVRLMNTAIMNGNPYHGKARIASTMATQDSNDFGRMFQPIMAPSLVNNYSIRAIHERVFGGLSTGASPWFDNLMRRPAEIGDLSDEGRRKMPALMRGADGRALCLTYRQIHSIIKSASTAMFQKATENLSEEQPKEMAKSDLVSQMMYRGEGNPFCILPRTAISNCFPGLEFDFRNLWRRAFKGILLIENNNLVLDGEGDLKRMKHHRLVGIDGKPTTVVTTGPTFPGSGNLPLKNKDNTNAVSFMEWSNNLAYILQKQGQEVTCYFTKKESKDEVVFTADQLTSDNKKLEVIKLTVNTFFEEGTAAFSDEIVEPGELTQGLCAPWQNDYRECACYYWAASRPDYVNVVPDSKGLSAGDNWMARERSGSYIPDDRRDSRLLTYDDLFQNWQGELSFIVKGFDAMDSNSAEDHE
ncbi:MAG: hypothetical protein WBB45_14945 [Cyclobacteriaceae bacterium]